MTTYVLNSAMWALAGLIVGYLLGQLGRRALRPGEPMPARFTRADHVLGLIVIVLALASVIVTAVSVHRQQQLIECQTNYNRAFTSALSERNEAAARERAAQRELLTSTATDQAGWTAVRQRYLDVLAQADAQRNANPLPEDPRC